MGTIMFPRHLFKPRRTATFTTTLVTTTAPISTPTSLSRPPTTTSNKARLFSSTPAIMVKVGDCLPDNADLVEDSPGNLVDLRKEIGNGKALIIGVPAAFSPACSNSHVPGYMRHPKLKDAGKVFVISVNDPFVMKAWKATLDPTKSSKIRFLGDPAGTFMRAFDTEFECAKIFGQNRSKRYAVTMEDGLVKEVYIEPDNTGVVVSSAERVLG